MIGGAEPGSSEEEPRKPVWQSKANLVLTGVCMLTGSFGIKLQFRDGIQLSLFF